MRSLNHFTRFDQKKTKLRYQEKRIFRTHLDFLILLVLFPLEFFLFSIFSSRPELPCFEHFITGMSSIEYLICKFDIFNFYLLSLTLIIFIFWVIKQRSECISAIVLRGPPENHDHDQDEAELHVPERGVDPPRKVKLWQLIKNANFDMQGIIVSAWRMEIPSKTYTVLDFDQQIGYGFTCFSNEIINRVFFKNIFFFKSALFLKSLNNF